MHLLASNPMIYDSLQNVGDDLLFDGTMNGQELSFCVYKAFYTWHVYDMVCPIFSGSMSMACQYY